MRYIAEYNLGKWLLVNTADASAKWYSTNYILQLSKTHIINGVVNGSVMLADKDKLSIYLRNMLKPTDYSFYLKPNWFYYIDYVSALGLYSLREYYENGLPSVDYRFQYVDRILETLMDSQIYNLIGSKSIVKGLQTYYIISSQNTLIPLGNYVQDQFQRLNLTVNTQALYTKGNSVYVPVLSDDRYCVINTQNNSTRFVKNIPSECMRLY